jgi:hypothetical protein
VTQRELFETKQALLVAAQDFFDRYKQCPVKIVSVIPRDTQRVSEEGENALKNW